MLYDFEGDVPSGELVVYTDEILTVTRTVRVVICKVLYSYCFASQRLCCYYFFILLRRHVSLQDVGEGWWEGISPNGSRGLFPEAYVEVKFEDCIVLYFR